VLHATQFQRKGDVVANVSVGQQPSVLEHHPDLGCPQMPKLRGIELADVLTVYEDLSPGWLYQSIDVPHDGGLAGAREPHDAEDLAVGHFEVHVGDRGHTAELLSDFAFVDSAALHGAHRLQATRAENLP
jgi:hypothetical protein